MKFKGSYCLCIKVSESAKIMVGALDMIDFCKGYYVYIGSALNGLKHRINRHVKTSKGEYKAIHWHIDYLLKHQKVEISVKSLRKYQS
jgi:Uri superfamily endonuclease